MASITRKFLTALGIEEEKQDQIIEAHTETVNRLKTELDDAKGASDKLATVQKELDDLKSAQEKDGKSPYKVKYEALKEEYEAYKTEQEEKQTTAAKEAAYKALLESCGVSARRIPAILRVTDLDGIELDDKGAIKEADKAEKAIKEEWADFIQTNQTKGTNTATPPANNGAAVKSREEIYARDESGRFKLDATQRQAALAQLIQTETKGS